MILQAWQDDISIVSDSLSYLDQVLKGVGANEDDRGS